MRKPQALPRFGCTEAPLWLPPRLRALRTQEVFHSSYVELFPDGEAAVVVLKPSCHSAHRFGTMAAVLRAAGREGEPGCQAEPTWVTAKTSSCRGAQGQDGKIRGLGGDQQKDRQGCRLLSSEERVRRREGRAKVPREGANSHVYSACWLG